MGLEQREPFIAEGECIRTRYLNGVINIPCLHLLDGIFQQSFSLICKALELEREEKCACSLRRFYIDWWKSLCAALPRGLSNSSLSTRGQQICKP